MVLSIICMSVSCLRLQHIKTYGDIYNYEYLGMDFSSVVPDPNAEARDEIVFPDVSKNWKVVNKEKQMQINKKKKSKVKKYWEKLLVKACKCLKKVLTK